MIKGKLCEFPIANMDLKASIAELNGRTVGSFEGLPVVVFSLVACNGSGERLQVLGAVTRVHQVGPGVWVEFFELLTGESAPGSGVEAGTDPEKKDFSPGELAADNVIPFRRPGVIPC